MFVIIFIHLWSLSRVLHLIFTYHIFTCGQIKHHTHENKQHHLIAWLWVCVCVCVWVVPQGVRLRSGLTDPLCCLSVPNSSQWHLGIAAVSGCWGGGVSSLSVWELDGGFCVCVREGCPALKKGISLFPYSSSRASIWMQAGSLFWHSQRGAVWRGEIPLHLLNCVEHDAIGWMLYNVWVCVGTFETFWSKQTQVLDKFLHLFNIICLYLEQLTS